MVCGMDCAPPKGTALLPLCGGWACGPPSPGPLSVRRVRPVFWGSGQGLGGRAVMYWNQSFGAFAAKRISASNSLAPLRRGTTGGPSEEGGGGPSQTTPPLTHPFEGGGGACQGARGTRAKAAGVQSTEDPPLPPSPGTQPRHLDPNLVNSTQTQPLATHL